MHTGIWLGNLTKIGHFEDLCIDRRIILKRVISLMSRRELDKRGPTEVCVAGCVGHELVFGLYNLRRNFFYHHRDYCLPQKKDTAQWPWLWFGLLFARTVHIYFATLPLPVQIFAAPEFKHVAYRSWRSSIHCLHQTVHCAIVSQLFHFSVTFTFVVTRFCSALEIDGARSVAANFPDVIAVSVCSVFTNVYVRRNYFLFNPFSV